MYKKRFFSYILILMFVLVEAVAETIEEGYLLDLRYRTEIVRDTAKMEIVYVHVAYDPVMNLRQVKYEMLTFGEKYRKYSGYENYQLDSVYMANPEFDLQGDDFIKFARDFDRVDENLLINPDTRELSYHSRIFINHYRYFEPLPDIDWKLHDETDEIMGMSCRKATATWRGRDWTAWYSDLPSNAGPWKFNGLPGLILKIEDSTGQHMIEAVDVKNDVFPFGYPDKLYCKTTREKFEAAYKDHCLNAGKDLVESGMVKMTPEEAEVISKRRFFYSPIELE